MRVVSTNVARVREITYRGKNFRTGIFKLPTDAPLEISPEGVAGDSICDPINHGGEHKAVYAFSMEHYAYWRETLENPTLAPGAFGENLTMSALDERDICIGDRLSLGSAVLEVSQPRVPCFKLGVALDDERAPALFTQNYLTGIYFRVITPGAIAVGDSAEIIQRHPAAISVHQLFRANFDRGYADSRDIFTAALKVQELSPEWHDKVLRQLAN